MKRVLLLAAFLIYSVNIFAQTPTNNFDLTDYGVRIEPDRRVMVVMASLEAAGLDTPLTAGGEKFRQELKTDMQGVSPELRRKLVVFVERYKSRFIEKYKQNLTESDRNEFITLLEKSKSGMEPKEKELFTRKYKTYFTGLTSPFISMAYTLAPAPDFSDPLRETDLPGDLLEVLDFAPLVRELYRAVLKTKLDDYVKEYQAAGDQMRLSTAKMVADLIGYLHTRPELTYIDRVKTQVKDSKGKKNLEKTEIRERTRRFYIVPEMLAPKETVNFRNIGDEYYAIVPPATNLSVSEVRRAYLQFVIDPLVLRNSKEISTVRDGIKNLLDERRKSNPDVSPDVFLAVSRSLVAAVDARQIEFEKTRIGTAQARYKIDQMKTEKDKLAVSAELEAFKKTIANETALQLSEAYEKGAVLAFYFADQLKGLEDSGFDIAGSMREYILALDATKETNRLAQYAEARKSALAVRAENRLNSGNQTIETFAGSKSPITKRLLEIDALTKSKNYTEAEKQLVQLRESNPSEPRVHYNLGRVASLSAETINDPEARKDRLLKAKEAYEKAILNAIEENKKILAEKKPDYLAAKETNDALMSLAYVALARIYEFYGEEAYAIKIYEAAIAVGNIPEGAYNEAFAARERLMKEQ